MKLTRDNYYTNEADKEYLSCSQYDAFMECEAKALASLQGRFQRKESEAFLVGNYFHTHFEGEEAHQQFCQEHFGDIYKTKTTKARGLEVVGKYAPFELADKMIATAEKDPAIKRLIDMPGENEKIITGKLFGVYPWKIRLDKYIPDTRMIIDWKTVANIWETAWNPEYGKRVTFVENYGYLMRAAVYMEIEKQFTGKNVDPYFILVCLSKQDPPDKEIVCLNHRQRLDLELDKLYERIGHIQRIKSGEIKPKRCGVCDYCRGTKRITGAIEYFKLEPGHRDPRVEDYALNG
ncbi:PD-(D/E)XK nuclease-like domain-containing protein [Aminipila luticellarii]|nr:PD-(D/E)XK nuclease-like domain-containing protein [Aminipila luticellarii]